VSPLAFVAAIFATSVLAGGAGALLGLGGGILLIPVLTLVFGVDLHYAMGASIVSVIATSSGAAAAYLKTSLSNVRIGLFLALATVAGALVGAALAGIVPPRLLQLLLGVALAYSTVATLRQIRIELPEPTEADPLALRFGLEGVYYDAVLDRDVKYRATRVAYGFAAMLGAGLLSGLLGIGSGAFKVLAMDHFMRLPMKVSTATSNFMIGITSAASAGIYFARGDIHPLLAAPVAIGVLVGAAAGTRLMARLRNTTIRKAFLPILGWLAVSMILRGLGLWLP
jgi:uncharacterized membrane protein YfcA